MAQIPIDAKRASHRECVRYIGALQAENGQLRQQLGQANIFITKRLREWPYSWANWIKPFFPKRPPVRPAVKVEQKEAANG